jgi:hypothetical protein
MNDESPLTPGYRLNSATVLRDLHRRASSHTKISNVLLLILKKMPPITPLRDLARIRRSL